jgi:dsDNA-specific endonuclease/ATPase MutS2
MKTLDLHGYSVDEAIDALDRFLYRSTNEPRVRVMTGKGTGAIFKAVTDYLKLGKYQWQFEIVNKKPNKGVLIVFMN